MENYQGLRRLLSRGDDEEATESQSQWSDEESSSSRIMTVSGVPEIRGKKWKPMKIVDQTLWSTRNMIDHSAEDSPSEHHGDSSGTETTDEENEMVDETKYMADRDEAIYKRAVRDKSHSYTPPADVWINALIYSFVHRHWTRQFMNVSLVLLALALQIFLPISMAVTLGKGRKAAIKGNTEDYKGVRERVNGRGMERLTAELSETLCGKFVDDYSSGMPYQTTILYKKWPSRNWHVSNEVSTHRSVLDDIVFLMVPVSIFSVTMLVVCFLWTVSAMAECREVFQFAQMLWKIPTRVDTQKCFGGEPVGYGNNFGIGKDAGSKDKKTLTKKDLENEGSMLELRSLPRYSKIFGWSIFAARLLVLMVVWVSGCVLLVGTTDVAGLIFNSLSLAFVLQIDNVLAVLLPLRAMKFVKMIEIKRFGNMYSNRFFYRVCFEVLLPMHLIAISLLVSIALRTFQYWLARNQFGLIASMCLFYGPTPDRNVQYDAVFPVPGFCESLLDTRCEVPAKWKDLKCTSMKAVYSWKPARCTDYRHPEPNSTISWEDWQYQANGTEFCVSSYVDTVKAQPMWWWADQVTIEARDKLFASRSVPLPQLAGRLDLRAEWSPELDLIRATCLSMWQTTPAMKLMLLNEAELENPHRPQDPTVSIKAFPRMRDASLSEEVFAAPFACGWTGMMDKVVTEDGPYPLGDVAMQAALANCSKHPPIKYAGAQHGQPCHKHVDCFSQFCDKNGRCDDNGCEMCETCDSGYNNYCGKKCQNERNIQCDLPNEPSISTADAQTWQVEADWKSEKWFYYNKVEKKGYWKMPR